MPRIVIDISAHGFGHLAQSAAVLAELERQAPALEIVARCGHPPEALAGFIPFPVVTAPPPPDVGMVMSGPSRVDIDGTRAAYRRLHERLPTVVEREAGVLTELAPDLVISNIPYTTLLAAAAAGLPSLAFCSLNWRDTLGGYLGDDPDDARLLREIEEGYLHANAFLRPEPSLPMGWLPNAEAVGPVARRLPPFERPGSFPRGAKNGGPALALVSLGGIASDFDPARLPRMDGVVWLTTSPPPPGRARDILQISEYGLSFLEALSLADVVVTKSGYGAFVEAASLGVRVLFAMRPDWPEAEVLEDWIRRSATAAGIPQVALYEGRFEEELRDLLARPASRCKAATGAEEIARFILKRLER